MTLEEAIKILEGKAEYWESKARKKNDGTMSTMLFNEEQAKVYRQGAEWLRELKKYRTIFKKVGETLANNGFTIDDLYAIYVKTEGEEVNADDESNS